MRGAPLVVGRHSALTRMAIASILTMAVIVLLGCSRHPDGPSSASVAHARQRSILVAEFEVPGEVRLGRYEVVEVWVEERGDGRSDQLVVRLMGPHVDREPRVQVEELSPEMYRHIWSEMGGPPYEVWQAPSPLPSSLTLTRNDESITVRRK